MFIFIAMEMEKLCVVCGYSMSIPPYAGYEEMVMKAKEQFFRNDLQQINDPHKCFLADAQGQS